MSQCKKVLVVEDEEDIRSTLLEILECEGYRASGVPDGAEALAVLRGEKEPTLVFLDLMMPRMSGWELLDHREALAPHKVVTMSVFESTASLQDPTPLDVDEKLVKPVTLDQVIRAARRFCGKPAPAMG